MLLSCFFLLYCCGELRNLHSFPTRRSSDLDEPAVDQRRDCSRDRRSSKRAVRSHRGHLRQPRSRAGDRKSTRLNSSHTVISYAVFCLKKKKHTEIDTILINQNNKIEDYTIT